MTDFVVMKDGQEVARYKNDRRAAEQRASEVEGEVVQQMAPVRMFGSQGKC